MKHYLYCLFAVAFLFAAAHSQTATAQADLRKEPGYLDLAAVEEWFDTEPWLEVNIKGALLSLITEASKAEEDPELTSILSKLKAIEVRGYPLKASMFEDIDRRTSLLAKRLEAQGWETVVRVRENDERVNVYLKSDGKTIAGLVVMVLDPTDDDGAIFVNIVGDIDPQQIGRIGQKFNIDPLTDFRGSN